MKTFKIIMNCIIAALLVVSLTINILALSGFRLVGKDTYTPNTNVSQNANNEPQNECNKQPNKQPNNFNNQQNNTQQSATETKDVFFENEFVRITYLKYEDGVFGPEYVFEIENISDKELTVRFSDLYIDNYQVFISGLTCTDLLAGKKAVSEMTLLTTEWEQFTDCPTSVSFIIEIVNPKSYSTYFKSDRINFIG
jgi:hypothetical protein